jgi:hypothetical protein
MRRPTRWRAAPIAGILARMSPRYFKRRWTESRGDSHDAWGSAVYFFETDDTLVPLRQIELYDSGQCLLYDAEHQEDQYGMLTSEALSAWDEPPDRYEIEAAEFEHHWSQGRGA